MRNVICSLVVLAVFVNSFFAEAENIAVKGKIKHADFTFNGEIDMSIKESIKDKNYKRLQRALARVRKALKEHITDTAYKKLELRVFVIERLLKEVMDAPRHNTTITQVVINEDEIEKRLKKLQDQIDHIKKAYQRGLQLELLAAATLDLDTSMDSMWDAQQLILGGLSLVIPIKDWTLRLGGGGGFNTLTRRLGLLAMGSLEHRVLLDKLSAGGVIYTTADKSLNGMNSFTTGVGGILRYGNRNLSCFAASILGISGEWAKSAHSDSKEMFGISIVAGATVNLSTILGGTDE